MNRIFHCVAIACLTCTMLLSGCSRSRSVMDEDGALPAKFPNHSYEEILQHLSYRPHSIDTYHSESALAVRSPIQSGSFSASISHRKSDSLLISISPGLGIVAMQALVTPDSFYMLDRINRELAIGTADDLKRLLPLPADSETLYCSLLGLWFPKSSDGWELTAGKSYYILKNPDEKYTLYVDPVYWRVIRYIEKDSTGNLVEERTFSDFKEFDGVFLPRRLTFRRPGDETSASLFHRKLTINPSSLAFDFNISKSTRRFYF